MKNNKSLTGAWGGVLRGYSFSSDLVADFVQMGTTVMGAWQERLNKSKPKNFQSSISGSMNGREITIIEKRNDGSEFAFRLRRSRSGDILTGQWRHVLDKDWHPARFVRLQGDDSGGLVNKEIAKDLPKDAEVVRSPSFSELTCS